MLSGMPTLPMSWSRAPRRISSTSLSFIPIASAINAAYAETFCELAQALVDFFEGLWSRREKTLERHAEIRFEDVTLPFFSFVGIEVIGGGDGVAALMFRKIHRSIGHLDKLLRRRAMERITRDAEASADVFLTQQRIGGYPSAELARQLPRVLHIGFRHQDDKLISAVTGHHIGAPAIGFQNLPDALQNEVAFEVPVKVVHEFEAVEVHEHQRKGAAGSSGPLPFRGQCFHEKSMRLHAGK